MLTSYQNDPFFICLNGTNEAGEIDINPENEAILREINKNMLYYYYCIDVKDYVFQKIDNRGIATFAVLPKFICIKSFVPLIGFYEGILKQVSDYMFSQRTLELKKERPLTDKALQGITNMKFEFEDFRIENKGTTPSRLLLDLLKLTLKSSLPQQINLQNTQKTVTYNVGSI